MKKSTTKNNKTVVSKTKTTNTRKMSRISDNLYRVVDSKTKSIRYRVKKVVSGKSFDCTFNKLKDARAYASGLNNN